jgi:hypothetical protein
MRQILYTMHFRGQASAASGQKQMLHTAGSAASCLVRTMVRRSGLETQVTAESGGDFAFFESDLRATGDDEFKEEGSISFGEESEHLLRFSTIGRGHMTSGLAPGVTAGSATWKVEGGEGQFAQARGFITTAFTLTDTGERSDYHCGLIFLPE